MALLEVENLTVRFHTRNGTVDAVNNASFAVEQGETLAIVGESGSGKSVTCYSLLGLISGMHYNYVLIIEVNCIINYKY